MITMNDYAGSINTFTMTLYGLSTDEKPTKTYNGNEIGNGSMFIEMDTSNTYMYDKQSDEWRKF